MNLKSIMLKVASHKRPKSLNYALKVSEFYCMQLYLNKIKKKKKEGWVSETEVRKAGRAGVLFSCSTVSACPFTMDHPEIPTAPSSSWWKFISKW